MKDVKTNWLNLGIDISEGAMFLLRPEKNVSLETVFLMLKTRAKEYELQNTRIEKTENSIRIISSLEEEKKINLIDKIKGKIKPDKEKEKKQSLYDRFFSKKKKKIPIK